MTRQPGRNRGRLKSRSGKRRRTSTRSPAMKEIETSSWASSQLPAREKSNDATASFVSDSAQPSWLFLAPGLPIQLDGKWCLRVVLYRNGDQKTFAVTGNVVSKPCWSDVGERDFK